MENNVTTSLLGLNDNSESDFESEDDEDIVANEIELTTKDKRGK
jgi:hypothetical protein